MPRMLVNIIGLEHQATEAASWAFDYPNHEPLHLAAQNITMGLVVKISTRQECRLVRTSKVHCVFINIPVEFFIIHKMGIMFLKLQYALLCVKIFKLDEVFLKGNSFTV